MLRPGLTKLYSYGEPRMGGKYPEISFLGIRMVVKDHFLQKVDNQMIEEALERSVSTFGTKEYFNREVWEKVRDLGFLPIKIMAAPEGMTIGEGNVCYTIESTRDWFAGTVNALESILMHTWYPTAVATRAMMIKRAITPYFKQSSDSGDTSFAVNDFGLRGATCHEAAARGGVGHLLHFLGSDNEPAMTAIHDYYGCNDHLKSVWATEHSVALSFGVADGQEKEYLLHQLKNSPSHLIISVVIDTKDSDNFIKEVVGDPEIMEIIKKRPGRVVLRPDSGDPKTNVLKYLDMLGQMFGTTSNGKKYRIINDNIGLLQGDGMDEESIPDLYNAVVGNGWSADNIVTGSGGGLLQVELSRDTNRWAIKPSFGVINGEAGNMRKIPKTDPTKASKWGRLKLVAPSSFYSPSGMATISSAEVSAEAFENFKDSLEPILIDGEYFPGDWKKMLGRAQQKW